MEPELRPSEGIPGGGAMPGGSDGIPGGGGGIPDIVVEMRVRTTRNFASDFPNCGVKISMSAFGRNFNLLMIRI